MKLFLASLMLAATVHAQFNGPAPSTSSSSVPGALPTTDSALLYPAAKDVYLGSGDLLTVRLFDSPDYAPVVRVSIDGTVQLPLIGVVSLRGLTVQIAETTIAKRLVDAGMYKDPQVSIQITESPNQFITVTGEIHGIVPVAGERRLFDILAAAGGPGSVSTLPASASHIVTILRPGTVVPIVVDLGTNPAASASANLPVFPRDTIVVSRIGVVYVLGAFKIQGAIPLVQNSPLTLTRATALSGGVGYEGQFDALDITRTVGLERKVIRVDIAKVLHGKAPDPVLQPDDIVYLPANPLKAAIKSGGVNTIAGFASILVYATH